MAVTVAECAAAIRAGDGDEPDEPLRGVLTRYLAVAQTLVSARTVDCPDAIADQAAIQIVQFLFDRDPGMHGDLWRRSGAHALTRTWQRIRALAIGD